MCKDELLRLYKLDYAGELKKWWDRLPPMEQETATEFIKRLVEQGHSQLWVYLAIEKIRKKDGGFFQWKMLLLNPSFQWEITQMENEVIVYKEEIDKKKLEMKASFENWKKAQAEREEVIIVKHRKPKINKKLIDIDRLIDLDDDELFREKYINPFN